MCVGEKGGGEAVDYGRERVLPEGLRKRDTLLKVRKFTIGRQGSQGHLPPK